MGKYKKKSRHKQAGKQTEAGNTNKNSQSEKTKDQKDASLKIQTSQQAIEAAKILLGWENEGNYSAKEITIKNCDVPVIRKEVEGKTAWEITLKDITLKFKRKEKYEENPYIQELKCIILADTGQLLKIESMIPDGVVIKPDRIPVEDAENSDFNDYEKIAGLPESHSHMSFRQILQSAYKEEGRWVSKAKQIIVFYLVRSYEIDEEIQPTKQPLWMLYVRGIPPFALDGVIPLKGEELVDPGSINYMMIRFTEDGKKRGVSSNLAPK